MSFGRQEYQHRFFKDNAPHKKIALYTPPSNMILPSVVNSQFQPPRQIIQAPPTYEQNQYNNQRSRVKTQPTVAQIQEYQNNAMMLEAFRRQAGEYRKRNRGQQRLDQSLNNQMNSISLQEPFVNHRTNNVVLRPISPLQNPEVVMRPDANLMARLVNLEQERSMMISRLEEQNFDTNFKLRDYRRKYNKLKDRLNHQLEKKKREESLQAIVKEELQASREKDQLDQIQEMMAQVSQHLKQNSQLLAQSLKTQESSVQSSPYRTAKQQKAHQDISRHKSNFQTFEDEDEEQEQDWKGPPPSVVYAKKSLDSQYGRMERTKKDIQKTNFRLRTIK